MVPHRAVDACRADRDLQHRLRATCSARWAVGISRHRLQRPAGLRRARVRRRRRDRIPVCLGADDAGHGGAGGDGARSARQPTRGLSVPRDVARGDRGSHRRLLHPGVPAGSISFSTLAHRQRLVPGPLRDIVFLLFFFGFGVKAGHHSVARLAARSPPGRAEQYLRADVRRDDQDGHLRHRPLLRLRPGDAAIVVGRARRRARRTVSRPRRAVCADAARSQAAAGVSQHREHRHHPAGRGRRHDRAGRRPAGSRGGRHRGRSLPCPESRGLQGPAVPQRRQRRRGDGHATDRGSSEGCCGGCRGPARASCRCRRHLRAPALQRLRQRVARVPGAAPRVPGVDRAARPLAVSGRRRRCWR